MKKLIIALTLLCSTSTVFSQIQVGGALGYNLLVANKMGATPSLNLMGEFGIDDGAFTIRPSFTYFLPKNYTNTVYAIPTPNNYYGNDIPVNYTDKLNMIAFSLEAKRFLKDGNLEDGGFYIGAGASIFLANYKSTLGNYDHNNYSLDWGALSKSYNEFMVRFMIGYEKKFDFGSIFGEAQIATPLTRGSSSVNYASHIPAIIGFQVGYKYTFSND